jgi:aminopeptidase N
MKRIINARNALIAAFLFFTLSAYAQTATDNFNRTSDYDVQHYILRVSFDRPKRAVIGDTTVRLKPLKEGFSRVTLDSVGISYTSVTDENSGASLKYRTEPGKIVVELGRAFSPQDTIGIRFAYAAVPRKGVYFVPATAPGGPTPPHSAQIWTQGEPEEARHWFPSFDFPSDKATVEQFITADSKEAVVGNGALVSKTNDTGGTVTHHFRMEVPFPTYLVSFVVGEYASINDKYKDIPLGYYVYPGTEAIVPKAYGKTRDMFRIFEEATGVDYPFAKYDQTIVSAFSFGGMENITATTMADTEIFLATNPIFAPGVEDLVSHELAHSWFGNLVTCRNWAELWLNEGFATFMEAVTREKLYGREAYFYKIKSDAERFLAEDAVSTKRHGLFNRNARNVDSLFDRAGTTYNKGGAVIHTLREQIGDAAFWKGVNIYLTRHRFGSVETTDLRRVMEEASGTELGWFFDQWVYGMGSPKLTVVQAYSAATKTLTLTVTQTQKAEKYGPALYRLPLEAEIVTPAGTQTEKLEVTRKVESFRFKVGGRPSLVTLDKHEKVPVKILKIQPLPRR